jgi:hypothetical protein
MTTAADRQAGRAEGERRKDAAHRRLEARRDWLIRRAREPDDAGAPSPAPSDPPSPAPLAVALSQPTLF